MGFDGVSYLDNKFYTAQTLAMILGGGMSSRLFQEVRENLGLAYSIYAFNQSSFDSGLFAIYAGTTPDKANQLITTTKEQISKICEKITDEELKRVKTQFEASLLMSKESTSSRMQKLGSDILNKNRIVPTSEIIEKISAINKSDVVNLANEIFSNSKSTFAIIGKVKDIKDF